VELHGRLYMLIHQCHVKLAHSISRLIRVFILFFLLFFVCIFITLRVSCDVLGASWNYTKGYRKVTGDVCTGCPDASCVTRICGQSSPIYNVFNVTAFDSFSLFKSVVWTGPQSFYVHWASVDKFFLYQSTDLGLTYTDVAASQSTLFAGLSIAQVVKSPVSSQVLFVQSKPGSYVWTVDDATFSVVSAGFTITSITFHPTTQVWMTAHLFP